MFSPKKIIPTSFSWIFYDKYLKYSNINVCLYGLFVTWLLEWVYLIEYTLNFWSYTRIIYPYRIPMFLLLCFMYWAYVWGISVWRRSIHGRFTRGDRKLWFKGFASFWVVELSTILGVYAAACWMSWGPVPLMPRYFLMQKKSFLFELTLFTYVVWIVYLMRMSLKWQLWKTQALLTSLVIFILSCLLWRDLVTLYTRDVIDVSIGSKWKYVKLNSIIYSMSPFWWTEHYMGAGRETNSLFMPFSDLIENNFLVDPFLNLSSKTEYEKYHWLPITLKDSFNYNAFCLFNPLNDYNHLNIYFLHNSEIEYIGGKLTLDSYKFYPRKIGFYPKKIAMWYFLVVLKIWHHIMLFIWWFFYLLRLNTKKKSSYTLLSACYFNVYCCFIICLLVYSYSLLPVWENFLRVKPIIRSKLQNWHKINEGIAYCYNVLTLNGSTNEIKEYLIEDLSFDFMDILLSYEKIWVNNSMECIDDELVTFFNFFNVEFFRAFFESLD